MPFLIDELFGGLLGFENLFGNRIAESLIPQLGARCDKQRSERISGGCGRRSRESCAQIHRAVLDAPAASNQAASASSLPFRVRNTTSDTPHRG